MKLAWDRVAGARLYAWRVERVGGEAVAGNAVGVRANWADIGPLLGPGTYEWQVRPMMTGSIYPDAVYGPWSTARQFTVLDVAAPAPSLPADGASLTTWPMLRWSAVQGAAAYALQVSDSMDPAAQQAIPVPRVNAFAFGAPGSTLTNYLAVEGTVTRYWRVRALIPSGEDTDWSPWRSFTVNPASGTLAAEQAATLLGPADCATSACPDVPGVPVLSWEPVAKASWYRVFFRWDGSAGEANAWVDVAGSSMPLTRLVQPTSGDRTGWAVTACPPAGCSEDMPTERRHFRVQLPAPGQQSPADGAVEAPSGVDMRWAAVNTPDTSDVLPITAEYDLEYRLNPGLYSTGEELYRQGAGHALGWTRDMIPDGTSLTWRVRASSSALLNDGVPGAWSPWRTVSRAESPVQLLSPASEAVVQQMPTLTWEPLPYTVGGYRVEVSKASILEQFNPGHIDWAMTTGTSSVTLPELAPGRYRWRVSRVTGIYEQDDGTGPWATGWFTIAGPSSIELQSPAPGETVQPDDAVLRWAPWPRATGYAILIGPEPEVTWDNAVYREGSYGPIHAVRDVLPAGQLYWKVCAPFDCSATAGLASGTSEVRSLTVVDAPTLDTTAPVGSISIAGGAQFTRSTGVTLDVTASDAGSGMGEVALSNDGTSWTTRTYAASQLWTLATANGTKTVHVKWKDNAGNWSAIKTDTIVLDTVPPAATAPSRAFVSGTALSGGRPVVRLTWSSSDALSGVARFELAQSTDGGAWTTVLASLTKPSVDRYLAHGHSYRFRVRPVDKAGNAGTWATGATFTVAGYSERSARIRYAGTWATSTSSVYWGGGARASSTTGARASFTFTGRSFAWVSRRGPARGKAEILVNGTRAAIVDLYASSSQNQRIVWARSWSTATSRTITIRVLGTAGRPRVDLDGIFTGS